ncbi:uncharacterized protein LOC122922146 isoform X2 [Bufo gargarizans]|uniref:uncharacterized protein LOC122922146 isoform X2 n=1 Tax=Bufo gargarizans TaxID=30331 RepID=UPI001CF30B87|nr:uncharacterized protein LOC122922146 isoform X2 [Bufo gargarizans]
MGPGVIYGRRPSWRTELGVQAPTHNICGALNSDITLSLASLGIKSEFKLTSPKKDMLIAKTENGTVTFMLNGKYELHDNGKKLVIKNVTEDDAGIYTVDITLNEDGEMRTETFNVTICGGDQDKSSFPTPSPSDPITQRKHRWIIIVFFITVLILSVVVLWKCWKRSSYPSGQGDQNNEDHVNVPIQEARDQNNEDDVNVPIQEAHTEESSFINIHQGKSDDPRSKTNQAATTTTPYIEVESTGTEKIIVSSSLY